MNYNRDMPVPSTSSLVEHLNTLYQKPEIYERVATACYERATDSKYQWDTIAQQFAAEFEQVLTPPEKREVPVLKRPKRLSSKKKVPAATT